MNTTPIEQCSIGHDAEYTVKEATERGWSKFSMFPNGNLIGTSPEGTENEPVPNYAQTLKDAAPELLAALEWQEMTDNELREHGANPVWETLQKSAAQKRRAAIAKAKGEAA